MALETRRSQFSTNTLIGEFCPCHLSPLEGTTTRPKPRTPHDSFPGHKLWRSGDPQRLQATQKTQQQGTGCGGSQASQTRKHLGQRQSRKESAFRPGCNLGSDVDCGRTCGLKTQTRSPAAVVGTGLPFSLPRVCLRGGGTPKSRGESKAGEALWEIKGKDKAYS